MTAPEPGGPVLPCVKCGGQAACWCDRTPGGPDIAARDGFEAWDAYSHARSWALRHAHPEKPWPATTENAARVLLYPYERLQQAQKEIARLAKFLPTGEHYWDPILDLKVWKVTSAQLEARMTEAEWKAECEKQALRREGYEKGRTDGYWQNIAGKYREAHIVFPDPPRPMRPREVSVLEGINAGRSYRLVPFGDTGFVCVEYRTKGGYEWLPLYGGHETNALRDLFTGPAEEPIP